MGQDLYQVTFEVEKDLGFYALGRNCCNDIQTSKTLNSKVLRFQYGFLNMLQSVEYFFEGSSREFLSTKGLEVSEENCGALCSPFFHNFGQSV